MKQAMLTWVMAAAVLLGLPLLFPSDGAISLLSQVGIWSILALSCNLLLGYGGMLTFGHALYAGVGAYAAIWLMNSTLALPVFLLPFAGALAGLLAGCVFGFLTTRRAGTTLAMITLGLAELVHALALMLPDYFGGEGGISVDRVMDDPAFGWAFATQQSVYYLIVTWGLLSAGVLYWLLATPFGQQLRAVRDNPSRVAFTAHDPKAVRYLACICAGMVAGVAGALSAVNLEIASAEHFSLERSAYILLFTYIGGTRYFWGPVAGATAGVLFTSWLPAFTSVWQLYLGLFFILVVTTAPQGIAGYLMDSIRVLGRGTFTARRTWIVQLVTHGLMTAGLVVLAELLYRLMLADTTEQAWQLGVVSLHPAGYLGWCLGLLLMVPALVRKLAMPAGGQA